MRFGLHLPLVMGAKVFEDTGGGLGWAAIISAFRKLGAYDGAALEIGCFGILKQAQACADNFAGILVAALRQFFLHKAVEVGTKVYIGHRRSPLLTIIGPVAHMSIDVLNRHFGSRVLI
jgi:hypothetical protein